MFSTLFHLITKFVLEHGSDAQHIQGDMIGAVFLALVAIGELIFFISMLAGYLRARAKKGTHPKDYLAAAECQPRRMPVGF